MNAHPETSVFLQYHLNIQLLTNIIRLYLLKFFFFQYHVNMQLVYQNHLSTSWIQIIMVVWETVH